MSVTTATLAPTRTAVGTAARTAKAPTGASPRRRGRPKAGTPRPAATIQAPGKLVEPDWITRWRQIAAGHTKVTDLHLLADTIRRGATFADAMTEVGLTDDKDLLAEVTKIGAKVTQMGKHATKVATIAAATPGQAVASPSWVQSNTSTGAHAVHGPDGWQVGAPDGWLRSRRKGDVRRAWAAVYVAEPDIVTAALDRIHELDNQKIEVTYTHYADLHAACRGALPPLDQVTTDPVAVATYLQVWDRLCAHVRDAAAAAATLETKPSLDKCEEALRRCFWLLPHAGVLATWIRTCRSAGDGGARLHAHQQLARALEVITHQRARNPRRVAPRTLSDLTITQIRAIAALDGHRPGDGLVAREETVLEEFAKQARATWASMAS